MSDRPGFVDRRGDHIVDTPDGPRPSNGQAAARKSGQKSLHAVDRPFVWPPQEARIVVIHTALVTLALAALAPEAGFRPASPDPAHRDRPAYLSPGEINLDGMSARYKNCIRLIVENVELGRRGAAQWASEGGGAPALHCLAIGDLAAGFPKLAAIRLTELAERSDAGEASARARIAAEAALAWLDAEDPAAAGRALETARSLAPDEPELLILEAFIHEASGKSSAAADAITRAEKAGVTTAEGYLVRARARRALGDIHAAAEDVAAALNLDPLNIDALTMRGDLAAAGVTIEIY